jgi:DNA-3-methyladenine glycosylase I
VLFEFITLEGAQAGLSWEVVLRKRARYAAVFAGFDAARVARFTPARIEKIAADPGVVRHRGKLASVVENARAALAIAQAYGSLDAYLWAFVGGTPIDGRRRTMDDVPATTPLAATISADLRKRGFRFVGPTIVYAFMQATGMVNDHLVTCYRHAEV